MGTDGALGLWRLTVLSTSPSIHPSNQLQPTSLCCKLQLFKNSNKFFHLVCFNAFLWISCYLFPPFILYRESWIDASTGMINSLHPSQLPSPPTSSRALPLRLACFCCRLSFQFMKLKHPWLGTCLRWLLLVRLSPTTCRSKESSLLKARALSFVTWTRWDALNYHIHTTQFHTQVGHFL